MRKAALSFVALLLVMTGCETGHVIEITMTPPQSGAHYESPKALSDCLHSVAKDLGMIVEGPTSGPAADFELTAKYPAAGAISGFFIGVQISSGRTSIVFRSLSNQGDPTLAERAFSLFQAELDRRGLKYQVRRN